MTILIVATAIAALVALVAIAKVNPFLAFLAVSIGMAIALGVPPADVPPLVQKGLGSILGGLTIVIAAGAMLGRLVVDGRRQADRGGLRGPGPRPAPAGLAADGGDPRVRRLGDSGRPDGGEHPRALGGRSGPGRRSQPHGAGGGLGQPCLFARIV
jgi:hypothetical protein